MGQDKKVRDGRIAFVLARDIGEAFVARDVDLAPVRALLAEALAERAGLSGRLAAVQIAHRSKNLCLARLRFQAVGVRLC